MNWKREGVFEGISEDSLSLDEYVFEIRKKFGNKLSSRANRSLSNAHSSSNHTQLSPERTILLQKLLQHYEQSGASLEEVVLTLIIHQLTTEHLLSDNWFNFPKTRIDRDCCAWVKALRVGDENCLRDKNFPPAGECLFAGECSLFDNTIPEIPFQNDDFLGTFYQSAQTLSAKSNGGSFYTPAKLLSEIQIPLEKSVYDPCCGSGNILMNILSPEHNSELVYASDIDSLALKICEANLVMFFGDPDMKAHIFEKSLMDELGVPGEKIDYVVTNPPWGAKFSIAEKERIRKLYPTLRTTESFSICLYNTVREMCAGGKVFFFLPKSVLNVSAHAGIRKVVLEGDFSVRIKMFGAAFSGVVSEVILLEIEKSDENEKIEIVSDKLSYSIPKSECKAPDYIIPAKSTPEDISLQKKLYSLPHITLENNCDFALGIVTGNNTKFLFDENDKRGGEPVYRGKNILPYCLTHSRDRIIFAPESFQQTAPENLYRERKIMYRFIANHLICAISEKGELPLNSANVFIPRSDYPLETIVALFNSSLYKEIYQKRFDSVKILKSHIKELPLPLFTPQEHKMIKRQYEKIIRNPQNQEEIKEMDCLLHHLIFKD